MRRFWEWAREYEPGTVGAALVLSVIGILLIYSAQHNAASEYFRNLYLRQSLWLLLAGVGFTAATLIPLRLCEAFAYVFLAVVWAVLILLILMGQQVAGAARWVMLGPANIQPSEVAKLALILAVSRYLTYLKRPLLSARTILVVLAVVGVTSALVLKQPDLGTSLVFWATAVAVLFWAGVPPLVLFLIFSPVLSLILAFHWLIWIVFFLVVLAVLHYTHPNLWSAVGVVTANLAFGIITPIVWSHLHNYQQKRILVFLDPGTDPAGAGYQIIQSKVAIGSGGLLGRGFLRGTQSGLEFLPARHTDFVFSVGAEEFGLLGGIVIVALFALLLWRVTSIGFAARNKFSRFLAGGILSVVGFQMLVNIGMAVGLMPVSGLPLPFVSYGGSSLFLFWTMIGLIVNIHRHRHEY